MALVKQIKNSDIFLPETVVTEEDKQELKQLVELLSIISIGLLRRNEDLEKKIKEEKDLRLLLKSTLDDVKLDLKEIFYHVQSEDTDNMTLNDIILNLHDRFGKINSIPLNKEPAYEERKYIIDADGKSKEVFMYQYIATTDQGVKHVEAFSWEKAKKKLERDNFKVARIYQLMKNGTQHQWY